jgi:hypothetical protein
MTSKPKTELMTFSPDGGRHVIRTAAGYDYAGWIYVVSLSAGMGSWKLVAKGWSLPSVHSRTQTIMNKTGGATCIYTTRFREAYPDLLTGYFGPGARLQVTSLFKDDWTLPGSPVEVTTRAEITERSLPRRSADFSLAELLGKAAA